MSRITGILIAVISMGGAFAATPEPAAYQPDWPAIAKHMVERSLALAPGERVLISYDPQRDPALIAALRTEILRTGSQVRSPVQLGRERRGHRPTGQPHDAADDGGAVTRPADRTTLALVNSQHVRNQNPRRFSAVGSSIYQSTVGRCTEQRSVIAKMRLTGGISI